MAASTSWGSSGPAQGGDVRTLSALKTIQTQNRFDVLKVEDEEEKEESRGNEGTTRLGTPTLGEYVVAKPRQAQIKQRVKQQRQQEEPVGRLCPLATIEPETLNPVEQLPEWEVLELAVDSGASETVISEDMVKRFRTTPSNASLRGVMYEVANGERIPNQGEKVFQGLTDGEGYVRGITAQVCEVNKPLLSVSKLVQAGNTVVFDSEGAYIEDKRSGERIWLKESGGMYMVKLWVPTTVF